MADIKDSKNWGFETRQLHIGQEQADPATDARAVPIYASSSYVFHNSQHAADRFGLRDAGNIYGRLTNPTEDVFEQRIASLEGGSAALAVASGAAAIDYTFQALAKTGEHIVAPRPSTAELQPSGTYSSADQRHHRNICGSRCRRLLRSSNPGKHKSNLY